MKTKQQQKEIPGWTDDQLKELLSKKAYKRLGKFLMGSTGSFNKAGVPIVYAWDVEKFFDLERTGRKENYLEWD
jgi:hypothetical protein